jgi:hypothetical protein
MGVFTTVYSRALQIVKNSNTNIPFPNVVLEGTSTFSSEDRLIDSNAYFIKSGIQVGDIVFSPDAASYAYVVGIQNQNTLLLSHDIMSSGYNYKIYQGVNQGCYIYLPPSDAGSYIEVVTLGGDNIQIFDPAPGVMPIQVVAVTGNTNIGKLVALW